MHTLGRRRTRHAALASGANDVACFSSDEIVLQVFPSTLDGTSTAGRLITGRDVNESKYMSRGSKRTRSYGLCGSGCACPVTWAAWKPAIGGGVSKLRCGERGWGTLIVTFFIYGLKYGSACFIWGRGILLGVRQLLSLQMFRGWDHCSW